MALPFLSFTDMVTHLQDISASKISTAILGRFINKSYRQIIMSYEWSARKAEGIVNTVDPYSTGTVAVTQASTTVTGTNTVWTSAMTGRFMRVGSSDTIHKFTYVSATSGTLEKAWADVAASTETYEIFQYLYTVDATAGEVGQILLPTEGLPIEERSLSWVNRIDPARRQTTGTPEVWIGHGVDSTGGYLIEFWPRYSAATAVRVPYYKRVDDISGSTQPILRNDLIECLASIYAADRLYSEFGDRHWIELRSTWKADFAELYELAKREDLERHNLPRAVQMAGSRGGPSNWQRYITEDW